MSEGGWTRLAGHAAALGAAAAALLGPDARAQCASNGGNYTATVSIGTVAPGDTDIGNHGDDTATQVVLPFSWSFYGTSYDVARVCSNGWLSFDAGSGTGYSNACLPQLLTIPAFNCVTGPAIMAFWDDLRTDMSAPGIFTSVSGSAPNRIFNIEWRAVYYANNSVPCNFEVRLYENSTRFDVVYGTMNAGGSGGTMGCQQGAGSGSLTTQYACATTGSNGPAAGTVITYDCQVAQTPSCSLRLSSAGGFPGDSFVASATVIPGSPATPPYTVRLDATELSAGTVDLYDDGSHGDAAAGDLTYTNSVTVGPGVPDGARSVVCTVTDSAQPGHSSTCSAVYSVGYCAASTGYTPCDPLFEYIGAVRLGSISNASTCSQAAYEDYTDISTAMAPGSSLPITIVIGTPFALDRCTVWVDWNGNGQFTEPDEAFPMSPATLGPGNSTFSGTLSAPDGAAEGPRRLRAVLTYNTTPVPCPTAAAFTYGNIEDYTIIVGGGCGSADFNCDGDTGTDSDIEAFFGCLAGLCPAAPCTNSADFNGDGDTGTDADIESFFRVLSGGPC